MDLKLKMKEAGIVGAGGAGFPSYAKLASGADLLLVNGAECEPLLYTDYFLLKREMPKVLSGISSVLDFLQVQKALLCVKEHTAKKLNIKDGETLDDKIYLKVLPDVYPMGDEISLIYQATGRVVKPGNLPITASIIVYNVETVYNVYNAVTLQKPVTYKYLTVGGNVKKPVVVKVPIGVRVEELLSKLGEKVNDNQVVIDGGPSMGKIINLETAVITKTTKAILILPKNVPAVESKFIDGAKSVARAETACCGCSRCTDLCPRGLLGYPLEPHKMVRTAKSAIKLSPQMVLSATLCCGCGICETLACCQGISPKAVINEYKALLAKEKLRYVGDKDANVSPEREYRMIPVERWQSVLGVKKYDVLPEYLGELKDFEVVEINLRQHIGAPSVPAVKSGDTVNALDVIASSCEGLSIPQHASVSGVVTVDKDKIIIEKN